MDNIISVEKPNCKKSRWDIFIIHYIDKHGDEYQDHVFEEEYNMRMFKQHLLEKGISAIDLDKYEELLYRQWERQLKL